MSNTKCVGNNVINMIVSKIEFDFKFLFVMNSGMKATMLIGGLHLRIQSLDCDIESMQKLKSDVH